MILFLLLISNSITILFQLQIIKNENLRKSLEISELSNEMMISKFNSLNKEYESNFKFLHSLLHTCAELNQLIDQKKYDELNLLIQSLSNKTIKEFNEIYTNSPIFSTVLNHKKITAAYSNKLSFCITQGNPYEAKPINLSTK